MRYTVFLKEKLKGQVEVEAADTLEAMQKAKRMIAQNQVKDGVMNESDGIVVSHALLV